MKIISYSLWGTETKYTIGAIRNAELACILYPGWICRFYHDTTVPEEILHRLRVVGNVELIAMNVPGDWNGMFWRFYALEDAEVVLVRDCDSRLSLREKSAVDEWLLSDKDFHIMRDHPWHDTPILGGMWGARNGILRTMRSLIETFPKGSYWQIDQEFLAQKIYPLVHERAMIHDESFRKKFAGESSRPFPLKRRNGEFVGQIYNHQDICMSPRRGLLSDCLLKLRTEWRELIALPAWLR